MGVIDNADFGEKLFILFFTPLIWLLAVIATLGLWIEDRLHQKKIIGLFIGILASLIFVKPTYAVTVPTMPTGAQSTPFYLNYTNTQDRSNADIDNCGSTPYWQIILFDSGNSVVGWSNPDSNPYSENASTSPLIIDVYDTEVVLVDFAWSDDGVVNENHTFTTWCGYKDNAGESFYFPAPTPTPTPTPTPAAVLVPFTYAPPAPQWSADYWVYGHYLQATSTQWTNPVRILGTPDSRYATIANSTGYAPLFSVFDLTPLAPASWGNVTGLKFDVIGKNISNIVIYPAYGINGSVGGTPVCTGKQVSAGSTLNHNYVTFTNTECGGYWGTIKSAIQRGDFGYKLTYYTGSAMTATIDSIAYLAVYEDSPYDITATNSARISPIAQIGIPLEVCTDTDYLCNMRNWAAGTLNYVFGIDQSFAANKFDALNTQMSNKIPFAYILALGNLDMGTAASTSAIPDFSMNYTSKYKGVEVFSTNVLVQQDDLPDLTDIAGTLRTVITIILWVSVIWFLVKYWRHLF